MSDVADAVRRHKVIIIYRGFGPESCLEISRTLYDAGLRLFEVTLNSEAAYESIRALRAEFGSEVGIGAGTVLDPAEVAPVADAGAGFVISPNLDEEVVARTKEAGLASIPGAFTPTEVVRAVRAGADLVKVFPISPVGPDYIRQLRGPLPDVPIVATGGVNAELAKGCLAQGCLGVGVGVHLLGARPGEPVDAEELTRQAKQLLAAVQAA